MIIVFGGVVCLIVFFDYEDFFVVLLVSGFLVFGLNRWICDLFIYNCIVVFFVICCVGLSETISCGCRVL